LSKLPKFPDSYIGKAANEYDSAVWMERNQKKTTLKLLNLLRDPHLGPSINVKENFSNIILELGCGTGFSSEIILNHGFRVIGIDILWDMLSLAKEKFRDNKSNHLHFIMADINYLPIRMKKIDHVLSVSAYNFIIHGLKSTQQIKKVLNATTRQINDCLKAHGRVIIEFYPKNEKELTLFVESFLNNGFEGFMIKKKPNQKGGQTFLLLKKKYSE